MVQDKKLYTISIYSHTTIGVLNKVTTLFVKKNVNIESITGSESEIEHIYRFTITVFGTEKTIKNLVDQLEKQVVVVRAFYHTDDEIVSQECALYKISKEMLNKEGVKEVLKMHEALFLEEEENFSVFVKTGFKDKTQSLYEALRPYGELMQFVRSGRISVSKPFMEVRKTLSL